MDTATLSVDALIGVVTSFVTQGLKYLPFPPLKPSATRGIVLAICLLLNAAYDFATGTLSLGTFAGTVVSYFSAITTFDHALKQ